MDTGVIHASLINVVMEEQEKNSFSVGLAEDVVADFLFSREPLFGDFFRYSFHTIYEAKSVISKSKTRTTEQRIKALKMNDFVIVVQCLRGIIGVWRHVVLKRLYVTVPSIQIE